MLRIASGLAALGCALAGIFCVPVSAFAATVVDASQAEAQYQAGNYREALESFKQAVEQFRVANKDSANYKVYREAAYLYDRLCDCCFTTRDWEGLKLYLDGLLIVGISERNLCETQLAGALDSGVAGATLHYLGDRMDEAVRLNSITQIKRTVGLLLLESRGEGEQGSESIRQYQTLAALMHEVLHLENGVYTLDINALDSRLEAFDALYQSIEQQTDIAKLWEKYPPESRSPGAAGTAAEGGSGSAPAGTS